MKYSRVLAVAPVFLACACAAQLPGLDALGRMGAAALPISPAKETEIGRGIAATLVGRFHLVDDQSLTQYVNLVGHAVAQQSSRPGEVAFSFGVLDSDDINAFAAPGGYVFITRGALHAMRDEAELAAVLAHEVAHVDARHVVDEIRRADVLGTVRDEAQLEGPILDRIAEVGSSALFTGLSRSDEMEADSLGMLYAAATGYRPGALLGFLERLAGEYDAEPGGRLRELGATHPAPGERAEALRRQLEAAGLDPDDGASLQERFRRFVSTGSQD